MTDKHPMNFHEAVITGISATVARVLTCEAAPVQLALRLLLSGQRIPIRALVTSSFHPGQGSIDVGTALDLIHLGLQQLHAHVDAASSPSVQMGNAAAVLAGDYLTTGAFRLLVRSADLQVLALVSSEVNRAAELEAANLSSERNGVNDPKQWARTRQRLAATLGGAAGATGATLAGYPKPLIDVARSYGETLVASHVLWQEAHVMECLDARIALKCAARDLCLQATQEARTIATARGNGRPLELAALITTCIADAGNEMQP